MKTTMKNTLVCLFVSISCQFVSVDSLAQKHDKMADKIETVSSYVRSGANGKTIFCGETPVKLLVVRKRVIFQSEQGSIDLKIVRHNDRTEWVGIDKNGTYYVVNGVKVEDSYRLIITPNDETLGLMGYIISSDPVVCDE